MEELIFIENKASACDFFNVSEVVYKFSFFNVFHDDASNFKLIIQQVQGAFGCSVVSGGCQ